MSDPIFALILIAVFSLLLFAVSFFKTLDRLEARVPIIAGVIAGVVISFPTFVPAPVAIGVILTIAALYARLTGRESEPADGMILGAMTGAAAAIPLTLVSQDDSLRRFAECVLAGAVAGYGITFGLTHVRDKMRQAGVDAITAAAAIGAAWTPTIALRFPRVTDRHVALAAAASVPLIVIATVFIQRAAITEELREEATLGFIDAEDVPTTAHPLLRLGRAGWHDAGAHREFVRIANRIALRKRQQRSRSEEVARLYQLEVIKLRMEMQEMARIDRVMRESPSRQAV